MATTSLVPKDLRTENIKTLKPRERILKTAYALFNEFGFNTVGVDRIVAESDVSKRSFYDHFPSKSDLMSATLEFRDWLRFSDMEKRVSEGTHDPKQEILAIFDSLKDWFAEEDFNGCAFNRGLSEFNIKESKPLRDKVGAHFEKWNDFIRTRLLLLTTPDKVEILLPQLLTLITGAPIVAQISGNGDVAALNKKIAERLLNEL
ncbi:TetR/AcrR family transcriptional regulator [Mucilaginibacter sp. cycad4]|uniref:TetR/AcrR family transcriptional regulator n=1 Tax=Mucilaginibacter sp. cycad4 TaxID=3342096 RepID=UPI002AAC2878|nr:TetR/AcrR family transcriptional regulator [Mucilaginibacter gossypii]WPU99186.1 TetR/AcrR family transcriptional regulator [Mucilaginibacter gossypii]